MGDARSRAAQFRTPAHVVAAMAHVLIAMNRQRRGERASALDGILLQHDGIGPGGHDGAREHAHGFARRRERLRGGPARPALVDDVEALFPIVVEIRRVHRVAVHGGTVERWQIDGGFDRLRGDAPGGVVDRDAFGFGDWPNQGAEFSKRQVNV